MGSDDTFRACDKDRERSVQVIRDAYVAGRLNLAEFHERTEAAFSGRTWGDLRRLTRDLPAPAAAAPPRASGGGNDGSSAGSPLPVLPIAVLWLVASLTMHSPVALIPIMFFLILAVRAGVRLRSGPRDRRDCPPRDGGPRRPGGLR